MSRTTMMTKSDTIAEIIKLNPSASAVFLSQFQPEALDEYLERLNILSPMRSGATVELMNATGAIRSNKSPAIAGAA